MPLCKILVDFENTDGWKVEDVVDITEPRVLIEQGKVELVDAPAPKEPTEEVTENEEEVSSLSPEPK